MRTHKIDKVQQTIQTLQTEISKIQQKKNPISKMRKHLETVTQLKKMQNHHKQTAEILKQHQQLLKSMKNQCNFNGSSLESRTKNKFSERLREKYTKIKEQAETFRDEIEKYLGSNERKVDNSVHQLKKQLEQELTKYGIQNSARINKQRDYLVQIDKNQGKFEVSKEYLIDIFNKSTEKAEIMQTQQQNLNNCWSQLYQLKFVSDYNSYTSNNAKINRTLQAMNPNTPISPHIITELQMDIKHQEFSQFITNSSSRIDQYNSALKSLKEESNQPTRQYLVSKLVLLIEALLIGIHHEIQRLKEANFFEQNLIGKRNRIVQFYHFESNKFMCLLNGVRSTIDLKR